MTTYILTKEPHLVGGGAWAIRQKAQQGLMPVEHWRTADCDHREAIGWATGVLLSGGGNVVTRQWARSGDGVPVWEIGIRTSDERRTLQEMPG
jgi:hypothetical protein